MSKEKDVQKTCGVVLDAEMSGKQMNQCRHTFGCARFVYNYFLSTKKDTYKHLKESLSYVDNSAILTDVKKEYPFLKKVDKFALQNTLKHLEFGFQRFFDRVQKKQKPYGYPRFKTKKRAKKSYKTNMTNNNIAYDPENNQLKLPKLGWVKIKNDKEITEKRLNGKILSATVTEQPNGSFTISVNIAQKEIVPKQKTYSKEELCQLLRENKVFAGDLGLLTYLTSADGHAFQNPKWLTRGLEQLKHLQKKHARAKTGSKNKEELRVKIAKQHAYIKNARQDYLHKLSSELVKYYDVFILEDLLIKGMVKNKKLAKSINDAAWGMFIQFLAYKAVWKEKRVVKINRFYPSSKLCNHCKEKHTALTLSEREWQCVSCKTIHDRDQNASWNILEEGVRMLLAEIA